MQKHRLLEQALPSLFPFSLPPPPPPPLFAPAMQGTLPLKMPQGKHMNQSNLTLSIKGDKGT